MALDAQALRNEGGTLRAGIAGAPVATGTSATPGAANANAAGTQGHLTIKTGGDVVNREQGLMLAMGKLAIDAANVDNTTQSRIVARDVDIDARGNVGNLDSAIEADGTLAIDAETIVNRKKAAAPAAAAASSSSSSAPAPATPSGQIGALNVTLKARQSLDNAGRIEGGNVTVTTEALHNRAAGEILSLIHI